MTTRFLHLLGVGKAGTTTLFTHVASHPDVAPSDPKEVDDLERWGRVAPEDLPRHLDVAAHAARWWVSSETRPVRLAAAHCLGHPPEFAPVFARSFPEPSRALVILREPVSRLVSAYRYGRSLGIDPGLSVDGWIIDLLDAASQGRGGPHEMFQGVRGGEYTRLLRPWADAYGTRLGVCVTEDLADPVALCRAIGTWAGLDDRWEEAADGAAARNVTVMPRSTTAHSVYRQAAARLRPLAQRAPAVRRAARSLYWSLNRGTDDVTPSPEVLERAAAYYAERNRGLADLLGVTSLLSPELPDWVG